MAESVVFRVWPGGDVLALFPNIDEGDGKCLSYEHIGQHASADYTLCARVTRPAKPMEYENLERELEAIGYVLKVQKRRSSKWMSL